MKKISLKRIAIGTLVGSGLIFSLVLGLVKWVTNPAFPALWLSDEEKCAEETSKQPYISKEYYTKYFKDCLMRDGEKKENPIIVPPEKSIDEVG